VTLEQAIHARWAATPALNSLLPADRVRTGAFHGEGTPYATLERKSSRTVFRTNAGDALDEVALAIHVWHTSLDAARAILQQVKAAFERSALDLDGGDRVVQVRRVAESARQHENNVWQLTVELAASVYLASGI
jgi:predicted lysophospholipase L1 biosynthesis ABC-type transport system permease subunit